MNHYGKTYRQARDYEDNHQRVAASRAAAASEPASLVQVLALLKEVSEEVALGVVAGLLFGVPRLRRLFLGIVLGAILFGVWLTTMLMNLLEGLTLHW